MEVDKRLFLIALLITVLILMSIIFVTKLLDTKREAIIDERLDQLLSDYRDTQTIMLLSETYGEDFLCIGLKTKLEELDKSLWQAGSKIEEYQEASSTFVKNQDYIRQKRMFNENEIYYLSLFKNFQERCQWDAKIVFYFYRNAQDCPDCDGQSFVLTDINQDIDKDIAIFSFDTDLGLQSVDVLMDYYGINVTSLPCVVIDEKPYCGIHNKDEILNLYCKGMDTAYCAPYATSAVSFSNMP